MKEILILSIPLAGMLFITYLMNVLFMYCHRINLFLGSSKLKKQNMKTIKLTLFALAAIMLNSCGGDAVE